MMIRCIVSYLLAATHINLQACCEQARLSRIISYGFRPISLASSFWVIESSTIFCRWYFSNKGIYFYLPPGYLSIFLPTRHDWEKVTGRKQRKQVVCCSMRGFGMVIVIIIGRDMGAYDNEMYKLKVIKRVSFHVQP